MCVHASVRLRSYRLVVTSMIVVLNEDGYYNDSPTSLMRLVGWECVGVMCLPSCASCLLSGSSPKAVEEWYGKAWFYTLSRLKTSREPLLNGLTASRSLYYYYFSVLSLTVDLFRYSSISPVHLRPVSFLVSQHLHSPRLHCSCSGHHSSPVS